MSASAVMMHSKVPLTCFQTKCVTHRCWPVSSVNGLRIKSHEESITFTYRWQHTSLQSAYIYTGWKANISHVWLCVFTTIKRKSPRVTFLVELSWLFWLLWQMLPHSCVNIEKGRVGMFWGFHLSSTSSRGTLSAGELWRRWVIKRPSSWKWRCKEIAAPLWTRLQQLQQQTKLTNCRWNCARAAGSPALGSAPDDAVALLHSNLLPPHASLLMHSYIPPGTR